MRGLRDFGILAALGCLAFLGACTDDATNSDGAFEIDAATSEPTPTVSERRPRAKLCRRCVISRTTRCQTPMSPRQRVEDANAIGLHFRGKQ